MKKEDELNSRLRDVKKRRYELHAQQKHAFKDLVSSKSQIDYSQPETLKLIYQGIPSIYRGRIWPHLIPNHHGVTPSLYQILLQKANQAFSIENTHLKLIHTDIDRTFPELKVFRRDNEQGQSLWNVLAAWTVFREDVGYIQGMSLVAGMLLLEVKQLDAFQMYCTIMTTDVMFAYYSLDIDEMNKVEENFQHRARRGDQQIYTEIKNKRIDIRGVLLNWVMTMFARVMDLDALGQLWDILLCNSFSEKVMLEVCYHLLLFFKPEIMNKNLQPEEVQQIIKSERIDEAQTEELFEKLRETFIKI